jgi:predicted amidophosphoribosyltransferase
MTQACCPNCRMRFSPASAAHIETCPRCAQPLHRIASAQEALGYPLFVIADPSPAVPTAAAVALPVPGAPQDIVR